MENGNGKRQRQPLTESPNLSIIIAQPETQEDKDNLGLTVYQPPIDLDALRQRLETKAEDTLVESQVLDINHKTISQTNQELLALAQEAQEIKRQEAENARKKREIRA